MQGRGPGREPPIVTDSKRVTAVSRVGFCMLWLRPNEPAPRGLANVGRRRAIAAAEGTVEIGQVAEAGFIGHRADTAVAVTRIGEHAMRARQPFAEHKIRERGAVFREQLTDIAFRYLLASREI